MYSDNKKIYDHIIKSTYEISMGVHIQEKFIVFDVKFKLLNEFDKFLQDINQMNLKINYYLDAIVLSIETNEVDYIIWPQNVLNLKIYINPENIMNTQDLIKKSSFENLPEKLLQLEIISVVPINLKNLPNQLLSLNLSKSPCKFNLDYLPSSLKLLYLSDSVKYISEELANLPANMESNNFYNNNKY